MQILHHNQPTTPAKVRAVLKGQARKGQQVADLEGPCGDIVED